MTTMTTLIELDEHTTSPAVPTTTGDAAPASGSDDVRSPASHRPLAPIHPLGSGNRPLGTVRPLGVDRRSNSARFSPPARFDVHQVPMFERWVAETVGRGVTTLVLDCSTVDFIDMAAIEAIARADDHHGVELAAMSLATQITFRLLDSAIPTSLGEVA
jgi:hypothetical protein